MGDLRGPATMSFAGREPDAQHGARCRLIARLAALKARTTEPRC